jgi:CDP-glycerol glycerophosphotransferase (TagB/SpsB family)
MKNALKLLLSESIHITLYSLACVIPKTKNRWVFGAWFGKTYNDNSKYLFEYVNQFEKSIHAVWITRNPEVKRYVTAKGYRAYLTYEPFGIWHMLTAQVALFCQNKQHDLAGDCIGPQTKLIQLWHGFSYKKYLGTNPIRMPIEKPNEYIEKIILVFARIMLGKKYTDVNDLPYRVENWHSYRMICALSNRHKEKFVDTLGLNPSVVTVMDYPRNDGMFNTQFSSDFTHKLDALKQSGARIGYFMPTFRRVGKTVSELFLHNIDILANYCAQNNIHIFIKLHHNDQSAFSRQIESCPNLHTITSNDIDWDLYPTLSHVDFIITDYSSIFSDVMLLGKPVIFVPFDLKEYAHSTGLSNEYEDLIRGKNASNWTEAVQLLDTIPHSAQPIQKYSPYHFSKAAFNRIVAHI